MSRRDILNVDYLLLTDISYNTIFTYEESGAITVPGKVETLHLIPGSFNPLHDAHKEIYQTAITLAKPSDFVAFELSLSRIGKPSLSHDDFLFRKSQFVNFAKLIVSNAPRFITKIQNYKKKINCEKLCFHVGADCISRMKEDYGLEGLGMLEADFIVYDRILNEKLLTLNSELEGAIFPNWKPAPIIRSLDSLKMSSTEIRKKI